MLRTRKSVRKILYIIVNISTGLTGNYVSSLLVQEFNMSQILGIYLASILGGNFLRSSCNTGLIITIRGWSEKFTSNDSSSLYPDRLSTQVHSDPQTDPAITIESPYPAH